MRRFTTLTTVFCSLATVALAQTNDQSFRSWEWMEDVGAARAAGIGGAFVGLADDASAVALNPAGMTTLRKAEILTGILNRGNGTLPVGDTTASRFGLGFVGGSTPVGGSFAVGGYVTEPHDERLTLTAVVPALHVSGYLQTTVTDAGAAVAWHPFPALNLGLRANVTHLRLQGDLTRRLETGDTLMVGTAAGESRLAGDAGALFDLTDQVRLGVDFVQGARWDVSRTAVAQRAGPLPSLVFQLSSPSRLSGGLSVRPSPRVTLTAQADYVLYNRLKDTFAVTSPPAIPVDYKLDNGVDLRGGLELNIPSGSLSVQLRGGVVSLAPSAFQFTPSFPPSESASWVGVTRRTYGTVGAGLVTNAGFRVDVAGAFGGERTVVSATAGWRF